MVNASWTFRRKQSVAALAAEWVAFANLLFLLAAFLFLQLGIVTAYGLFVAVLASIGFAAMVILLILVALGSLWRIGAKAGWASIRALLYTALIAAPFIVVVILALSLPPTFDMSSDRVDPPAFPIGARGEVQELPFMEGVLARNVAELEDRTAIDTRRYTKEYEAILATTLAEAKKFGWVEQSRAGSPQSNLRIGYAHETFFFNLPIDIVIRVTEVESGVEVDMRSALQLKAPDLGYNAYLIASFFAALDEIINAPSVKE